VASHGILTAKATWSKRLRHGARHPYRRWFLAATALFLLGTAGSIYSAVAVTTSGNQKMQHAFTTSSAEISDVVQLYVHHQLDLITSVESFLLGNEHPSSAQFTSWTKAIDLLGHNKDLGGLGVVSYVTAAQLPAFVREQDAEGGTPFVVTPSAARPYYCFAAMGIVRPGLATSPRGYNLCSTSEGPLIVSARNDGEGDVVPYDESGVKVLAFETPVYRGGVIPTSVAGRQHNFVALIALTVEPKIILASTLKNYPKMAISLSFDSTAKPVFTSGIAPKGAAHVSTSLGDGWTIEVLGRSSGGGLFANNNAVDVLFGGIALSLVVAILLFMLGTDRTRLRRLVDDRTEQLNFQATHDMLTGLPNRTLIIDRTEQILTRNRRANTYGAALFIDLDDFKNVNDSLGHEAGDRLLVLVAARMKAALREVDTIGRVGGDEFVVLLDGGETFSAPEIVAQRLLDAMREPFELSGSLLPLIVNTSIGIAVGDRPSGSVLLRDADVALYQAKAKGKNKYVFFDQKMEDAIGHRLALEFDLRSALSDHQFRLFYQPIYALGDLTIVGVEALLRWEHPKLGLLGPDEFIPALERTGQIRDVGAWVLHEACAQVALWHERGDRLYLSVNVSGRQFDDHALIDQIRGALDASGLDGRSLCIEVTETALMLDMDSVVRDLGAIKSLGTIIAIDDFGTGYSSLSSLRELPVDCIKIDQSFVSSITTSDESMAVVRTFIQLGRDLGLRTVAEGVETFEQMDLLRACDVDFVQGFLFSRPLEPKELEAHLLEPRRPARPNQSPPRPHQTD
jgi:diguanylate cyclase (GGDEF)-like protein